MGVRRGAGRRRVAGVVLATTVLGCSADDPTVGRNISERDEGEDTASEVGSGPNDAAFVDHGPYEVGITTLHLPDRSVEVFYPAVEGSSEGRAKAAFDILNGFSENIHPFVPENVIIPVEVDGYRELPVSRDGPFPVVLFSHGMAGWRTVNSILATEIASWGFVVASADHIERNLEAVVLSGGTATPKTPMGDYGASTMASALDLVVQQGEPGGVLAGAVDPDRVGAVGHSAGANAAMSLATTDERVDTVVSWAASGPVDLGDTPLMIIAAENDITTANLQTDIQSQSGLARVVTLLGSGHSVFIDICPGLTTPDGVIGRARETGVPLPDSLLALVVDGCEPGDAPVTDEWPTILHFTVAQLRDALGIGAAGAGLGEGVVDELPAAVTYEEHS